MEFNPDLLALSFIFVAAIGMFGILILVMWEMWKPLPFLLFGSIGIMYYFLNKVVVYAP